MFKKISKYKANYKKGQIFPFLLAIIVIVLIMIMITVNLGQLGVLKTDVSNASDSAALAAASILSGTLLGLGITSDTMFGEAMGMVLMLIILEIITVVGIPVAIATWIAWLVSAYVTYSQALGNARMGWANAKKTALEHAFQNVGIDEPKPSFKQFLKAVYGITDPSTLSESEINYYHDIYFKGDDPGASQDTREMIRNLTQSGVSGFMQRDLWKRNEWGDINPQGYYPAILTNGYGWKVDNQGRITNTYRDSGNYKDYDNYVEVEVIGSTVYPLQFYGIKNVFNPIIDCIQQWIGEKITDHLGILGDLLDFVIDLLLTIVKAIISFISNLFPLGLEMPDEDKHITKNPIQVTVRRFRKPENLGLWNFRYGVVESTSHAHAFKETGNETISPLMGSLAVGAGSVALLSYIMGCHTFDEGLFDTRRHLFETKLISVK